jgi:hypothetical protein
MFALDIVKVSPPGTASVKPLRTRQALGELTRQGNESRREADVLKDGISLIVARNYRGSGLVGHRGGDFIESGMQQIRDDLLDGAAGKQLAQGMQARRILHRQSHRVLLRRPGWDRILSPMLEQGLEFHDYSAIPDLPDTQSGQFGVIIDRAAGL